jgi:chromosome partitioning protein
MPVVIAFVSQKGGVGKSTLARALAVAAARAGWKVKLVDLDPLQRTLVLWEKRRRRNNVAPAIEVDAVDDFRKAIAAADRDTLLIFDTPGQVSQRTQEIAERADLIVQPTGPAQYDLHPALLLFQALTNVGVPEDRLVFALCRTLSKREEGGAYHNLMASGYAVLPGSIPEDIVCREAHDQGKTLTETRKGALNRRALALLDPLLRCARGIIAASRMKQRERVRK